MANRGERKTPEIEEKASKVILTAEEENVADIVARGGIIAYPTETVYGLGVDPFNENAVIKLYRLKGWKLQPRPVSILLLDVEDVERCVRSLPDKARHLIDAFWPGPLTLVLPAVRDLSAYITGNSGMVGLRVSSHSQLKTLLSPLIQPITATSANPTSLPPARTPKEVRDYFGEVVDWIAPNPTGEGGGQPSTVVRVEESGAWSVIRAGAISHKQIGEVISGDDSAV